jgi:hypothetical protein
MNVMILAFSSSTWHEWLASNIDYFILQEKASSTNWSEGKEHFVYAAN